MSEKPSRESPSAPQPSEDGDNDGLVRRHDKSTTAGEEGVVHQRPHLPDNVDSQLRKLRTIERARQAARELQSRDIGSAHPNIAASESELNIPDYDLIHPIGSGAFGTVWLALNRHDHQFYAIKTIDRGSDVELKGVRTFKTQSIDNPYLVPIGHVGLAGDVYYYVMPLADDANGPSVLRYEPLSLRTYINRLVRVPLEETLRISRGILKGLELLHAAGGIHRDIKPENILRFEGTWKLGDSGFVRSCEQIDSADCGTPGYCPPDGSHDRSADLYALGKTMFQLLTGAELSEFRRLREDNFPLLENDSAHIQQVRQVILRASDDDSQNRFESATEMLEALPTIGVQASRRQPAWLLGAVTLVVLAALGAWLVFQRPFGPTAAHSGSAASLADRSLQAAANKAAIDEVTIRHYGQQGESILGLITAAADLNDSVSLLVELNKPAYAFLIACDPNGKTQLISGKADDPPRLAQSLVVPQTGPDKEHVVYTLNDCPGVQAFVLVVSSDPLPSYEEWAASVGFLEWQYDPLDEDVVWQFSNGQFVCHMPRDRGDIEPLRRHPEFLSVLRNLFDSLEGIDAYEIWAFRVRPVDP